MCFLHYITEVADCPPSSLRCGTVELHPVSDRCPLGTSEANNLTATKYQNPKAQQLTLLFLIMYSVYTITASLHPTFVGLYFMYSF